MNSFVCVCADTPHVLLHTLLYYYFIRKHPNNTSNNKYTRRKVENCIENVEQYKISVREEKIIT